jgi:hypothetical protein
MVKRYKENKGIANLQETRFTNEDNRYLEGDGEKPYLKKRDIQNPGKEYVTHSGKEYQENPGQEYDAKLDENYPGNPAKENDLSEDLYDR